MVKRPGIANSDTTEQETAWTRGRVYRLAQSLAASLFDDDEMGLNLAVAANQRQQQTIDMRSSARKRRSGSDPSKVLPNDAQILQFLVFETSRIVETAQEEVILESPGAGVAEARRRGLDDLVDLAVKLPISRQVMTRRYIAAQICEGLSLNSQNLAVVSGSLLRSYSVGEAASLYDLLAPPNPIAEKFAYRQREKARHKLNQRFAHFVALGNLDADLGASLASATAQRFLRTLCEVRLANNEPYRDLIRRNIVNVDGIPVALEHEFGDQIRDITEYLMRLIPWGSPCVSSRDGDDGRGFSERFASLIESSDDRLLPQILRFATKKDRDEIFRVHALICPRCYRSMAIEIFTRSRECSWLACSLAYALPAFALTSLN